MGTGRRSRNLDAVRLALALVVCVYHAQLLAGMPVSWMVGPLSPTFAVTSFFFISGFLIFRRLSERPSIPDYALDRVRRIYPLYVAVVIVGGLAYCQTLGSLMAYLATNAVFLNFAYPGPGFAINGSLWSMKVETGLYLLAPLMSRHAKSAPAIVLGTIIAMSLAYRWTMPTDRMALQLPGQIWAFALGGLLFLRGQRIVSALSRLPSLPMPRRDLSYGLYLFHYPIALALPGAGWSRVIMTAAISVSIAAIVAYASRFRIPQKMRASFAR